MLKFELENSQLSYAPGETLLGILHWSLDEAPEEIKISLLWFTQGRGTEDIKVVEYRTVKHAQRSGRESFSFRLPDEPPSFQGTLITLSWAVEALTEPGEEFERQTFILGPDREAFHLERCAGESLSPAIRSLRKALK